ncbi:MAG: alpha/beta hydrolase [Chloroflexales bacterium]|nr:alpha/beta hydrolase [Chloroflexales bacterium]
MTAQAYTLTLANVELPTGFRMHYAEQGDPADRPLLLLHGLSDSWFSYSRVLPSLARSNHVYALDQRGHGDSDRPAGGYRMQELAADVVAFMNAMGLPQVTLAGHSMGSIVATHVALAAPERLAQLILIGANTSWDAPELVEFKQVIDALEDPIAAEFVREFQASTAAEPLPEAFMERVVAESLKLPARVWRAAVEGVLTADYAGHLDAIRMPTLVIGGEQDPYCPAVNQRELAARLQNAELTLYAQLGHAPHWEHPEAFVRDVVAFLSR